MRTSKDKITEIFYLIDNFCQELNTSLESHIIGKPAKKKPQMSKSEVITIMVQFHMEGSRCMKHFYLFYVQEHLQSEFPKTV